MLYILVIFKMEKVQRFVNLSKILQENLYYHGKLKICVIWVKLFHKKIDNLYKILVFKHFWYIFY